MPFPEDRDQITSRGFTLVELMIVVVIVVILATVAIIAYTRHIKSARLVSARAFMAEIQARQEAYFQRYGYYAMVSAGGTGYYPALGASGEPMAHPWAPAAPADGYWDVLGARPDGGVSYFQYRVTASTGPAHTLDVIAAALGIAAQPGGSITPHPWYYVIGRGNLDGTGTCADPPPLNNGDCTMLYGTSAGAEIIIQNEGR